MYPLVPQSNKYSEGSSLTSLLCSAWDVRASVLITGICFFRQATHCFQHGKVCKGEQGVRVSRGEPRVRTGRGTHKPTREGLVSS